MTNAVAQSQNALRNIKSPLDIPNFWLWILAALGVLALASLAVLAWRLWKTRQAAAAYTPPVPAHVRAKLKLREALALISQPKPFCIAVSDTLRLYLEERFTFLRLIDRDGHCSLSVIYGPGYLIARMTRAIDPPGEEIIEVLT